MGGVIIAGYGFLALFGLMLLGVPIGFAMMAVGVGGITALLGVDAALSLLGQLSLSSTMSYELSVAPLFILMGAFILRANISGDLYEACQSFLGHRRGGLALATIAACGGFAAVSGSSVATTATMARVAMPSMRRYGYYEGLIASVIAAGGTLGILIPPSVVLVVYGILTGTDISKLFLAGLIPGALAVLFYMLAVQYVCWRNPEAGPRGLRVAWSERWRAFSKVGPIVGLFVLVIGGLYLGIFTPTESGGVGALGALVYGLATRRLPLTVAWECALEAGRVTAMLFLILVGAYVFSAFLNFSAAPSQLSAFVQQADLSPLAVMAVLVLIYLILGCFLESMSMVVLTVPVFFPLAVQIGFDPVWFGIIVVLVTEVALITPPVGLNLFVVKSVTDHPLSKLYRDVTPFVMADMARICLLILVPSLILVVPGLAQ